MKIKRLKLPVKGIASYKFWLWLYEDYNYLTTIEWTSGKRKWRSDIVRYRPIGAPRRYEINNKAIRRPKE